jgi:predicted acyl esterase
MAHAWPHFVLPGPQIGFLQEMLRWWDHWLKGRDTGVMDEPMLRAWMTDSVAPARHHETLPGRWVAESAWSPGRLPFRLFLSDDGLRPSGTPFEPRTVCSTQKVGAQAGEWCPFGRGHDQAGDQREDDVRSLVFETPALDETIEILGAPVVTFDLASDKPIANLAVRLCDVRPSGESLRVSFGILNLTHRDSHATPALLVPGQRYRVRIQLNDCGAAFPAGHRIRLAISTAYWPMIWPAPERATVTIFAGALDLPARQTQGMDALLAPLPKPDTATPDPLTPVRPGVMSIDRLGLELGAESRYRFDIADDDLLAAVAEMHKIETKRRGDWEVRVETHMRLSCTHDAFRLRASLRAWEGGSEVCSRTWDRSIPRDLL